jgi:hypothetical protein
VAAKTLVSTCCLCFLILLIKFERTICQRHICDLAAAPCPWQGLEQLTRQGQFVDLRLEHGVPGALARPKPVLPKAGWVARAHGRQGIIYASVVLRERPKPGMTTETVMRQTDLPEGLENALRTLTAALDRLDAARERCAKADSLRANLEEELAVMQDDRLKLAVELDGASARTRALESANDEVKRRLAHVSAEIRAVLSGLAGPED